MLFILQIPWSSIYVASRENALNSWKASTIEATWHDLVVAAAWMGVWADMASRLCPQAELRVALEVDQVFVEEELVAIRRLPYLEGVAVDKVFVSERRRGAAGRFGVREELLVAGLE